jgi:hypothetical protein
VPQADRGQLAEAFGVKLGRFCSEQKPVLGL